MTSQGRAVILLVGLVALFILGVLLFSFFLLLGDPVPVKKTVVEPDYIFVSARSNIPLIYDASNDPYPSTLFPQTRRHRSSGSERDSLTEGLFAWFKFDESGNVTSFGDSSGEGNSLTCSGNACPATADGRIGRAAVFDGFDNILLANDDSSLHPSSSVSIATWVHVNSIRSTWGAIVLKNDGTLDCRAPNDCSNREYGLWVRNDGGAEFDVTPANRFGTGKVDCLLSTGSVPFNRWVHLAAVANGDDQTMKIYVDGDLVQTCSQPTLASGIHNSNGPLMVGRVVNATWGDSRIGIGGSIDDLRLYNRALSADEIQDLS